MTGTGFHFNHTQCHTFDDERVCGLDLMDNEEPAWGVNEYSTELYTRKGIEIIDNHDPNEVSSRGWGNGWIKSDNSID